MSQSEFEIIQRYFAQSELCFARTGITLGIGDDAALVSVPPDRLLAMSMDVLVESVHFPAQAEAGMIANRALAVNLSDLAAMAAEPFCFNLGLTLPQTEEKWLKAFSLGLLPLAREFNCPLVGGDTTAGPLSITIQVQGLVDPARVVRRSGAKVGDKIYVSGFLGDGAIALLSLGQQSHLGPSFILLDKKTSPACARHFANAYYQPVPRIELARQCAAWISSGIDISDGLVGDLGHLLRASKVGAQIFPARFPYSASARSCVSEENRLRAALYGGDDYELCMTVAAEDCARFEAAAAQLHTPVTRIGEIVAGNALSCLLANGESLPLAANSYQHFQPKV